MRAGVHDFNQYGSLNTIDALADGDLIKWEEIMAMRYEKVFLKLQMNRTTNVYQKKYHEIMIRK